MTLAVAARRRLSPHRAPELRPPCAPGTLVTRPTRAGRARSGTDGVGRAPPRRAATGDMDKDKERERQIADIRIDEDQKPLLLAACVREGNGPTQNFRTLTTHSWYLTGSSGIDPASACVISARRTSTGLAPGWFARAKAT